MGDIYAADRLERRSDGRLAKFSGFGRYPLFYMTAKGDVLCTDCADAEEGKDHDAEDDECECESEPIAHCDANYEDPSLYCDECSERIESAYVEDHATGQHAATPDAHCFLCEQEAEEKKQDEKRMSQKGSKEV